MEKDKMPSVAGIVGSPRKGMNSDVLVDCALEGCRKKGFNVRKIYLNDLDIRPCQACRVQDGKGCRFGDGMSVLKEVFENCDGLVLGIPIYYGLMSSQVKLMIDRSYCFAARVVLPSGETYYQTGIKKKKLGLMICVSDLCQNHQGVSDCIRYWSDEINLKIAEEIYLSHRKLGMEARKSKEVLEEMRQCGERLCDGILND